MIVGPPATRTDEYLAAILDELRALRVAVEGGGPQEPAAAPPIDTGEAAAALPATKRTRQRPARKN